MKPNLSLRDGLRANPDSYEILLELGKYYNETKKDPVRARNVLGSGLGEMAKTRCCRQKARRIDRG